ncbi:MAG: hypothetical protein PWP46_265 [Fusobacteriaceae bacterium]|jgi:cystathionine beta-lyase family protein involved in aluminum resistance|nr:hypothetical protein [Fusobacteriales bacterium]MDN5303386.1 hypothetical protein [Fusobacteriaceae bacterium]
MKWKLKEIFNKKNNENEKIKVEIKTYDIDKIVLDINNVKINNKELEIYNGLKRIKTIRIKGYKFKKSIKINNIENIEIENLIINNKNF